MGRGILCVKQKPSWLSNHPTATFPTQLPGEGVVERGGVMASFHYESNGFSVSRRRRRRRRPPPPAAVVAICDLVLGGECFRGQWQLF